MSLRLTPLAAIFLALSVPAADAAVWRVTPADDVEDIVDNAEEGDTIIFAKGEYKVNLLLTEPLSLKGEDGAVINAGGKGSGITIRRSRTTVENLTIKNYGGDLYKRDSGVRVMDGCTGVKLTNLKLFGSGFGIRADRLDNLEIRDCEITGNSRRHILDRGDGVFLNYVKHSKLINNKVKNVRDGFYFENTDATEAVGNHFDNTQYGIHWMYTRNDIGYDNVTVNSVGGFALMSSKRIMCRDNTARDNVYTTPRERRRLILRARDSSSTVPAQAASKATPLREPTLASVWHSVGKRRSSLKMCLTRTRFRCATSARLR